LYLTNYSTDTITGEFLESRLHQLATHHDVRPGLKKKWNFKFSAKDLDGGSLVHDGKVFIIRNLTELHCLDLSTGERIWQIEYPGVIKKHGRDWPEELCFICGKFFTHTFRDGSLVVYEIDGVSGQVAERKDLRFVGRMQTIRKDLILNSSNNTKPSQGSDGKFIRSDEIFPDFSPYHSNHLNQSCYIRSRSVSQTDEPDIPTEWGSWVEAFDIDSKKLVWRIFVEKGHIRVFSG
jgi:hypothetical protein